MRLVSFCFFSLSVPSFVESSKSAKEIEAKDWSLSPGRYVGVDTATDENFDYEARLADIHIELEGLNEEAAQLAQTIMNNYKEIAL